MVKKRFLILKMCLILKDKLRGYKMNYYRQRKAKIREEAIDFQCSEVALSYFELAEKQLYFYKYGKRYGLLKEFRNEGII